MIGLGWVLTTFLPFTLFESTLITAIISVTLIANYYRILNRLMGLSDLFDRPFWKYDDDAWDDDDDEWDDDDDAWVAPPKPIIAKPKANVQKKSRRRRKK